MEFNKQMISLAGEVIPGQENLRMTVDAVAARNAAKRDGVQPVDPTLASEIIETGNAATRARQRLAGTGGKTAEEARIADIRATMDSLSNRTQRLQSGE